MVIASVGASNGVLMALVYGAGGTIVGIGVGVTVGIGVGAGVGWLGLYS